MNEWFKSTHKQKYFPNNWYFKQLDNSIWFLLWNHWLNPVGNYLEPLPFPEKRYKESQNSLFVKLFGHDIGAWLWWTFRNPFHNFSTHWIGIVPAKQRYIWYDPEENGWEYLRFTDTDTLSISFWKKPYRLSLPYVTVRIYGWEIGGGWKTNGSFVLRFRKY